MFNTYNDNVIFCSKNIKTNKYVNNNFFTNSDYKNFRMGVNEITRRIIESYIIACKNLYI